ncbi:hypothetical protein FB45DRAFT_948246 [Roridomyces roridus]|uniref:Uncharacterized protein n=1 Tax=Roridomyces roridus TaxID=1738132 RepID=A0AAD7FA10_9AGAR|nr:hypothetical protein FB45DRAFT_948246 [Roridomyces roridus]
MSMNGIALDKASLIALVLETFNLGVFTVMFGATLRVIHMKRVGRNPWLLPTLCLLWLLSMVHWIIDVVRAMDAFIDSPDGALVYYANVSNPLQAAKTAVYVTLTLTGDFFVIYRCYIVWNRSWFIVTLPCLLWLATGVVGYATTAAFLRTREGGIFLMALVPWVTSFICMTLSTNVVCTILIAYRILRARMEIHKSTSGNSLIYSALIIFLESAATYSSALVALVTVYLLSSNAQFIVLDMTAPLIGITFCMIILRIATADRNETALSNPTESINFCLTTVNVSRLVDVSGDGGESQSEYYGAESFGGIGSHGKVTEYHDAESVPSSVV